jgi:hypothetical protein
LSKDSTADERRQVSAHFRKKKKNKIKITRVETLKRMFKKKIRKSFRRKIAEGKKKFRAQPDGGVATVNIRAKREMDVAACAMGSKYRNLFLHSQNFVLQKRLAGQNVLVGGGRGHTSGMPRQVETTLMYLLSP